MEAGASGIGETIQELEAFFYADDRIFALPYPERLHREFNVLTYLFDRFGLNKNVRKTVSTSFRPCYTPGGLLESEYMHKVTGVGLL